MCHGAVLVFIHFLHWSVTCWHSQFKVGPGCHQSFFSWAKSCLASCTRAPAPACSPISCRLLNRVKGSGLLVGHNSSDIKPGVSWHENSTAEHAHSASAIPQWCYCFYGNHAGGSRQVSNFLPTISRWMNSNHYWQKSWIISLFWWIFFLEYHRGLFFCDMN